MCRPLKHFFEVSAIAELPLAPRSMKAEDTRRNLQSKSETGITVQNSKNWPQFKRSGSRKTSGFSDKETRCAWDPSSWSGKTCLGWGKCRDRDPRKDVLVN